MKMSDIKVGQIYAYGEKWKSPDQCLAARILEVSVLNRYGSGRRDMVRIVPLRDDGFDIGAAPKLVRSADIRSEWWSFVPARAEYMARQQDMALRDKEKKSKSRDELSGLMGVEELPDPVDTLLVAYPEEVLEIARCAFLAGQKAQQNQP